MEIDGNRWQCRRASGQRKVGSSRSRNQSPNVLTEKEGSTITALGISNNQGAVCRYSRPYPPMLPRLVIGGCTPRPRNDRPDSSKITSGNVSVTLTMRVL